MEEAGGMLGDIALGTAGVGGILWAVYERFIRHRVERANADSEVAVLTANETLFTMLTQRLSTVEEEVKHLRRELDKEREYTRTLINFVVTSGLTPPPYNTLP